jgi:hypothetical protein
MLEINGLEKRYGTVVALDGASFTARPFVIGGRVYSGAVLQTGGRMKLRDAWRASP